LDIPSVETADMTVPAAVNKSTAELKKPTDHLSPEARFDIESDPYVLEDCLLPAGFGCRRPGPTNLAWAI
jgi:hypothetical protein